MRSLRSAATRLPLRVLWGLAGAGAGLILAVAVTASTVVAGSVVGLAVGLVCAVGAGLGAALGGRMVAQAIRALRVGGEHDTLATGLAGAELAEAARMVQALRLRAQVADELSEQHRRSAETASAGMFELLSGLVQAEEGARGQLAAELHDTAAQSLMLARSLLASGEPADVERAGDLVAEAEDQVRAVMARTRPPALRDGDLARALTSLRDDLEVRYGLRVAIEWPDEPHPLPLVTAVTVYRFFQESLLNVVKHADVDTARLCLEVTEATVTATVVDEGPGFDPQAVRPDRGRHVGLGLLRERARLAGGTLEVVSAPGRGTTVVLELPRAGLPARALIPRARTSV